MDIVQAVAQVGFPIAVAAYLLIRLEQKLEAAEQAARELATDIRAHIAVCTRYCIQRDTDTDK